MTPDLSRSVTLIDLSALYHQAYSVVPETDPISKVHEIVLRSVAKAADVVPGAYVAICCDSKTNWRKDLSPEYKAQREKKPRSFFSAFDDLKERLRKDARLLWEADGFEADDVIASAADALTLTGHKVTIVSPDKDLSQLVSSACSIVSTAYDPWVTRGIDQIVEKFGVTPSQMGAWLALIGDKSDNVKGADGIGPTKASLLINTFGGIDKIYQAAHDTVDVATNRFWRTSDGKKPLAMHDALIKAEADVRLAAKLVALRYDAPINIEQLYEHREIQPLTTTDVDFEDMISPGPGAQDSGQVASVTDSGNAATAVPPTEKPNPAAEVTSLTSAAPSAAGQGSTALVKADNAQALAIALADFDKELQPVGMPGLFWLARRAAESGLYPEYRNPSAALLVMARGHDFNLSPAAALELLRIVKGHICMSAHLLIERAKSHPDCEYFYFKDKSETSATAVCRNRKNPEGVISEVTYTIEMAKKAGLWKADSGWDKHGGRMCVKMAGTFLGREEFPSAFTGAYAAEEFGGE